MLAVSSCCRKQREPRNCEVLLIGHRRFHEFIKDVKELTYRIRKFLKKKKKWRRKTESRRTSAKSNSSRRWMNKD